ncbi:ATP-binding protein [Amorphoplanes digitatis]|uniref:ATP-binding protein n=1 Tax=Actinoplanes digitatis TaxID=1868 RepID=UPI0023B2398B|nr:ATP-binding protein [Actinoplanes digitatis]
MNPADSAPFAILDPWGHRLSTRASLARTAAFATLYAAAIIVGRMTVMADTRMALVWPAAGVAVVWFCAQRGAPKRWVDVAALITIAWVGNAATGTGLLLGGMLAVANLVMAVVFVSLLCRFRPSLWGAGGTRRLSHPRELASLLAISAVAAAAGAVYGLTGLWLMTGNVTAVTFADWMARQVTGMFVIATAGLWLGHRISTCAARTGSARGCWNAIDRALRAVPALRVAESLAVVLCSAGAYLIGFVYDGGLPLAFPLIVVTVWAGLRLSTTSVVLQNLILGTAAMVFTLQGEGPFATIDSPLVRTVVAQLFVVLITTVGLLLALGRDERVALLAELAAHEEQAARHAALMNAVIDSMADGLSVIDAEGRITLRNPAGVRMLGPADAVGDVQFRLSHLDGTPIDTADLPSTRAARGETVDPVDVRVTDQDGRDTHVYRVTATPLTDEHGRRSAVVLYHDVTAERRHHAQLADFAGVVAHDLQTPLTVVEGWTEVAAESLDAAPGHPAIDRSRDGLTRVTQAATRMRGLINDLLAYTSARDADLAPAPVDLTELVRDIAAGRTDAAVTAGQPVPQVVLDPLEPVHADAGAVRQLLENLIGNAVKYTAPGVTPRLSVTSTREDGTVRITIADNGIGIPAGQHEAIFDNFHRAHPGTGYAGTGIGLAICHRIVARHGGTITAEDNPGGGSRFVFTLPAAELPAAPALVLPTAPAPAGNRRLAVSAS